MQLGLETRDFLQYWLVYVDKGINLNNDWLFEHYSRQLRKIFQNNCMYSVLAKIIKRILMRLRRGIVRFK